MKDAPLPESTRTTTYQLTEGTVSPVRILAHDDEGTAIEETISCYPIRETFVDKAGNICDVVMCNGRTTPHNSEAERYAALTRRDWLLDGGLPLRECPHAPNGEYMRLLKREQLIIPTKGAVACDHELRARLASQEKVDEKTCCPHLQAIIKARRAKTLARVEKANGQHDTMSSKDVDRMMRSFGEGMRGDGMSAAEQAKNRLRREQGETDK